MGTAILTEYLAKTVELLEDVKQKEAISIRRTAKAKAGAKKKDAMSDSDKITAQLLLDVQAFGEELDSLAFDTAGSSAYGALLASVQLPVSTPLAAATAAEPGASAAPAAEPAVAMQPETSVETVDATGVPAAAKALAAVDADVSAEAPLVPPAPQAVVGAAAADDDNDSDGGETDEG